MSSESGIEWCDRSWEVTAGCTKVSSGCAHCYAEKLVGTRLCGMAIKRIEQGTANGSSLDLSLHVINENGRWNGHIELLEMNLGEPLSRRAPTVYFVNSRSDLFHEDVPFEYIDRVFAVMALCPRHRFLVLTKRPERMREYFSMKAWCNGSDLAFTRDALVEGLAQRLHEERTGDDPSHWLAVHWPLPNVWLGTSVEDQETADARLPELLGCPAAGRFISAEPLLGGVELLLSVSQIQRYAQLGYTDASRVQSSLWVIVGGESGAGARPCSVEWVRSVKNQCRDAGVPVFVKQLGADPRKPFNEEACEGYAPELKLKNRKGADMDEWPRDLRVREVPGGVVLGKGSGISHSARGGSATPSGKTPSARDAGTSPARCGGGTKSKTPSVTLARDTSPASAGEASGCVAVSGGKSAPDGMVSDEPGSAYTIGGA